MSADNGVYILHDPLEDTWRVAHAQAIDNLDWYVERRDQMLKINGDTTPFTPYPGGPTYPSATDALKAYLQETWGDSEVYTDLKLALMEAWSIYRTLSICEYGISSVEMPNVQMDWVKTE